MAYTSFADHVEVVSPVRAAEDAVHTLVHSAFAPLRRFAKYRQVSRELAGLSNRELAELGIARRDIRRVAREGARTV